VPARELLDYDGNPRRHPQAQRDALRDVLEYVGIAGALAAASEVNPLPTGKGIGEPPPISAEASAAVQGVLGFDSRGCTMRNLCAAQPPGCSGEMAG
jgi:hypothetical protein